MNDDHHYRLLFLIVISTSPFFVLLLFSSMWVCLKMFFSIFRQTHIIYTVYIYGHFEVDRK